MLEPRRARSVHARNGADGGRRLRRSIVALLVLGLALAGSVFVAPAPGVAASNGGVIQITTNATGKANLVMSDELVAWQESSHIFIYTPAGGVVDISGAVGGSNQLDQSPQVSGDRVVWWTQANGRSDIYTWAVSDPVIRRASTDSLLYSQDPQISGDRITFMAVLGAPPYQVFTWTPEDGTQQVSTGANSAWPWAKVSGDCIAYLVRDNGMDWSLYSWVAGGAGPVRIASDVVWDSLDLTDMADGRVVGLGLAANSTSFEVITWASGDTTVTRVGAFTAQDHKPRVSGGRIVWEGAASESATGEVDTWSVTDPIVSSVTDDAVLGVSPDISGNRVVWAKSLARTDDPSDPMYPRGFETQLIGTGPVLWTLGASTFDDIPYTDQLAGEVLVSPSRVAFLGWEGDPFNGGVQQVYLYTSPYTLTYTAGAGGTISGTSSQTVDSGGSGTLVTAIPNAGYHFVSWSDAVATAARTDAGVTGNITVTATFAINQNLMPVWRFRNLRNGFHLWSADPSEKANIINTLSATWLLEGVAYNINTSNPLNSSALWRFRNIRGGFYLYTADPGEMTHIKNTLSKTWTLEGVAYNVSRASGAPVWRFRNRRNGTYLYSADPNEVATIVATLKSTWLLEGVAYSLAP